jgi:hypothetical protein
MSGTSAKMSGLRALSEPAEAATISAARAAAATTVTGHFKDMDDRFDKSSSEKLLPKDARSSQKVRAVSEAEEMLHRGIPSTIPTSMNCPAFVWR